MGLGRLLMFAGIVLLAVGIVVSVAERLPIKPGHLPGDIIIRGKGGVFYFPIVTCIVLSVVLSLILWLVRR